ncbi:hypothetical protein CTRI78_v011852 [Colletotrichum trifolii]|uniref:Uncharacterized protein n=1 Tax=Colletotrichum trifolii TaxID=5466 RepID=A0A4R8Q265_COLTR|nr:hypothetical protein CTRI78_v011852 [Colletotrichum trifolii]
MTKRPPLDDLSRDSSPSPSVNDAGGVGMENSEEGEVADEVKSGGSQQGKQGENDTQPRIFTLWVLIEDTYSSGSPIDEYRVDRAPFCNVELSLGLAPTKHTSWMPTREGWKELERRFEPFLQLGETHQVHQSLLTSLMATCSDPKELNGAIRSWNHVQDGLKTRRLHSDFDLDPTRDVLIILLMDTGFPFKQVIKEQYGKIDEYLQVLGPKHSRLTHVYPNRQERYAAEDKFPDIRALDLIAQTQKTWRPTTCFGFGECALNGIKDIKKRTWSCSSVHTKSGGNRASYLGCTPSRLRRTTRSKRKITRAAGENEETEGAWFHQEHVKILSHTELRVFIVTHPDSDGTRGLRGRILRVCCTHPTRGGNVVAVEADEDTYDRLGTTEREVCDFSLGVFEALRDPKFGWARRFESLEVGCRLDVSISEVGGSLFVNEMTRWNGASYFSDHCAGWPHSLFCSAYAKAWGRYVQEVGRREIVDA